VTHGVLSGGAVARVSASPLQSLVITDSIQATEAVRVSQTVRQLTIAPSSRKRWRGSAKRNRLLAV